MTIASAKAQTITFQILIPKTILMAAISTKESVTIYNTNAEINTNAITL